LDTDSSEYYFKRLFFICLISGFAVRILFLFFFTDLNNLEFYEYGALTKNLHAGNGYSLFYFNGDQIEYKFKADVKPFASAYIPPGYVFFLYPFFFIDDIFIRNLLIIFFQILISLLVIVLLFKFTELAFDKKAAVTAAFIYALLPEFIVTANSINIVTFFHAGVLVIFILLSRLTIPNVNYKRWIPVGITFGIFILFRSEAILFLLTIILYLLSKKLFKPSIIILTVSLLTIFPWQLRNIFVFNEFIPASTSMGVNFYRGHNPYGVGVWADEEIGEKLKKLKDDRNFEQKMNKTLFSFGLKSIEENPVRDLVLSLEKIVQLWFYNYNDSRTNHPLYLIPWFLMLVFTIFGFYNFFSWEKHKYVILFLIYFTFITFIFFALPRYQTMMKIALLPFAAKGLIMLYEKMYSRLKH